MKAKSFLLLLFIPPFILNAQITPRTQTREKSQYDVQLKNVKLEEDATDTTTRNKYIEVVNDKSALPIYVPKDNIHSHPPLVAQ